MNPRFMKTSPIVAIWRIGAVSYPIVPIYGVHEIAVVVDQIRPPAVITSAQERTARAKSTSARCSPCSPLSPASTRGLAIRGRITAPARDVRGAKG